MDKSYQTSSLHSTGQTHQQQPTTLVDEILSDHRELETYFQNYKNASNTDESNQWFNQYVWELCRHSVAEELVFYPLLESIGERGKQYADEARKDHHMIKELLSDVQKEKDPSMFDSKMQRIMENLKAHIKKEETEDLVFLKSHVSLDDLQKAARSFTNRKKIAPTRPHTSIPEKSSALEGALGLLLAPVDKFRDLFTSFPTQAA